MIVQFIVDKGGNISDVKALTNHGYVHEVEGAPALPKGEYPFTCQIHSQMRGTLVVE